MHKTLRTFTIMAAMSLSFGLAQLQAPAVAWAQNADEEAQIAENDARRSQPGVVKREAPGGEENTAATGAENAENNGQEKGVEGGVIFGESLDRKSVV